MCVCWTKHGTKGFFFSTHLFLKKIIIIFSYHRLTYHSSAVIFLLYSSNICKYRFYNFLLFFSILAHFSPLWNGNLDRASGHVHCEQTNLSVSRINTAAALTVVLILHSAQIERQLLLFFFFFLFLVSSSVSYLLLRPCLQATSLKS